MAGYLFGDKWLPWSVQTVLSGDALSMARVSTACVNFCLAYIYVPDFKHWPFTYLLIYLFIYLYIYEEKQEKKKFKSNELLLLFIYLFDFIFVID